jgi:hypothetical protein
LEDEEETITLTELLEYLSNHRLHKLRRKNYGNNISNM